MHWSGKPTASISLKILRGLLCQKLFADQLRSFQLVNLHQNLLERKKLREINTD